MGGLGATVPFVVKYNKKVSQSCSYITKVVFQSESKSPIFYNNSKDIIDRSLSTVIFGSYFNLHPYSYPTLLPVKAS